MVTITVLGWKKWLNYGNSQIRETWYLLPGVISKEKYIILPVDKYKLPAWSMRVFQFPLNSEHLSQFSSQLMIAAEPGDVQWAPNRPWFIDLEQK